MIRALVLLTASTAPSIADEALNLLQTASVAGRGGWGPFGGGGGGGGSSKPSERTPEDDNLVAKNRKCAGEPLKKFKSAMTAKACREVCRMEAQCKFYASWPKAGNPKKMRQVCIIWKGDCAKKQKLQGKNTNTLYQIIRTTTTTTLATTTPDPDETTVADVASASGDPHIATASGERYDLFQPGHVEFMTIPAGASAKHALLKVTGETEQMGERKNDLWIRRVHVEGKWLDGDDFSFKTGHAAFGDAANYLARMSGGKWVSPQKLLKASDGKMSLALYDDVAPTHDWEKSEAAEVALNAGPVKVLVSFATSKKDTDVSFNHFDVHLSGLQDVSHTMSGVLATSGPGF